MKNKLFTLSVKLTNYFWRLSNYSSLWFQYYLVKYYYYYFIILNRLNYIYFWDSMNKVLKKVWKIKDLTYICTDFFTNLLFIYEIIYSFFYCPRIPTPFSQSVKKKIKNLDFSLAFFFLTPICVPSQYYYI